MGIATAPADSTDESTHPYVGLENADTNYASWFDPQEVGATEDFESNSDWRKTHKRTYWKHLLTQHKGHKNGGNRANKSFQTYLSNRHLSMILANTLGLTQTEQTKAETWFRRLKFERLGYSLRLSGFCVCLYLVKHDELDERDAHPNLQSKWSSEFRDYYEALTQEQQRCLFKAYGKVASQIRSWTVGEDTPASREMDKFRVTESHFNP